MDCRFSPAGPNSPTYRSVKSKSKSTISFATCRGYGTGPERTNHGKGTVGAEYVWMALLGPEVPPLGVRSDDEATLAQVAATLAMLMGSDFLPAASRAAPALPLRPFQKFE